MKSLILIMFLSTLFTSFSYAAESSTDCLMMREGNERSNPKANLSSQKLKPRVKSKSSAQ